MSIEEDVDNSMRPTPVTKRTKESREDSQSKHYHSIKLDPKEIKKSMKKVEISTSKYHA